MILELLMGLVLQPPPQPGCPSLDTLQPLHVLLGGLKMSHIIPVTA